MTASPYCTAAAPGSGSGNGSGPAFRRLDRVRNVALQMDALALRRRVRHRHRRQECLSVWVQRAEYSSLAVAISTIPAEIHHRDASADMLHHRQIVER